MSISDGQGTGARTPLRLTPKTFVALLFGLLLSVLAFSQAAASTSIKLDMFRPLGGSFFSWRSAQRDLTVDLFAKRSKIHAEQLIRSGRTGLTYAPLSARSLWMVGKGYEEQKKLDDARRVMARAQGISRRDAAVQLWLAEDAFRREDIPKGLAHYDLILRAEPAMTDEILPRLAAIMVAPQGRRYLLPYARSNNPWFSPLLTTAANRLAKAEPVGRLLLERRAKAPAIKELDQTYAGLMTKMVNEGSVDIALQVYPLLPNARKEALSDISGIIDGKVAEGYPPFIWSFASEAYGATLVSVSAKSSGMEFYGAPGTVGVAASKLVTPGTATQLRWRVIDRATNLQSAASWVATCVSGKAKGAQETSINLLDRAVALNKAMVMPLPANCSVVRVDMRVAGGIGTNPASLIVDDLKLVQPPRTN